MDKVEEKVAQHLTAKIEANGSAVDEIQVQPKTNDAYICYVRIDGAKDWRQGVVTVEELGE